MLGKLGVFVLMLVVVSTFSSADPVVGDPQQQQIDVANRYLSAEVTKQIKLMEDELLKKINDNNDANMMAIDQRMTQVQQDIKQRVVIGGIGAILIANAFIGFAYLWVTRRYSYERFLERLLERKSKGGELLAQQQDVYSMHPTEMPQFQPTPQQLQQVQEAQATQWQQPPEQTLTSFIGQRQASNLSAMNEWQFQAAHEDAWKRPGNVQSYVSWEHQGQPIDDLPDPTQQGDGR